MAAGYSNYQDRFISLANLKLPDLPASLELGGDRFVVKPEFHITLLAVERIAEIINKKSIDMGQKEIVADFYDFVKKQPLTEYELLADDLRLVRVDGSRTIIAMAEMPRIQELFARLSDKYDTDLPVQPAHITLYTLPGDTFGIPIFSYEDLENISEPIQLPGIQKTLK